MTYEAADPADHHDGLCLEDTVLAALAQGTLGESTRTQALLHLDECEVCQALLAEEVRLLPQRAPAPPSATALALERRVPPPLLADGSLLADRYQIRNFLSRGGMGEVYEAHDTLLGQRVALKTLSAQAATHAELKAQERFKQEVLMARRVADPHVCRIHEFGQHVVEGFGPVFYLTMELIDGKTLGARVRSGPPLTLSAVKALSRQLLLGLAAAHAAGVLHRDFKSDNVMLRARGSAEEGWDAVILDFGLARGLERDYQGLTEQHEFLGSAGYMAPEQLLEGEPLSEATDLYAFGVVLFEMLTQRLPFQGRSARAVAFQRLVQDAPLPSSVVPGLSAEWDALVARCLQREVPQRFASAWAVLEQLDALDVDKPAAVALREAPAAGTPAPDADTQLEVLDTAKPTVAAARKRASRQPLLLLLLAGALVLGFSVLRQQRAVAPVRLAAPVVPAETGAVSVPVVVPPSVAPAEAQLSTSRLAVAPAPMAPAGEREPAAASKNSAPVAATPQSRKPKVVRPQPAPAEPPRAAPAATGDDIGKQFYTELPDEQ